MKKTIALMTLAATIATSGLHAQITPSQDVAGRNNQSNIIMTAASFLTIAPDSRAGGLGDAGVATTPDTYSQHWNPAKYLSTRAAANSVSVTLRGCANTWTI